MDGIGPFFLRVLIFLKQIYWNREKKNMIHAVSAIRWNTVSYTHLAKRYNIFTICLGIKERTTHYEICPIRETIAQKENRE